MHVGTVDRDRLRNVLRWTLQVWPCGHPRTPSNTKAIGDGGNRCRTCRRAIERNYYWRKKEKAA